MSSFILMMNRCLNFKTNYFFTIGNNDISNDNYLYNYYIFGIFIPYKVSKRWFALGAQYFRKEKCLFSIFYF